MPKEVEAKFKVESFRHTRTVLEKGGAVYLGTSMQTDRYFDTPQRSLLASDCGLRMRATRRLKAGAGRIDVRPLITYKGPGKAGLRAKVRHEFQTHVDNPEAMAAILDAAGLKPTMTIQKRRASYRFGRCLVELDELPLIGKFVEIESSNVREIRRAARKLGLGGQPISEHYISLLRQHCKRVGRPCEEVTFDGCRNCPNR